MQGGEGCPVQDLVGLDEVLIEEGRPEGKNRKMNRSWPGLMGMVCKVGRHAWNSARSASQWGKHALNVPRPCRKPGLGVDPVSSLAQVLDQMAEGLSGDGHMAPCLGVRC